MKWKDRNVIWFNIVVYWAVFLYVVASMDVTVNASVVGTAVLVALWSLINMTAILFYVALRVAQGLDIRRLMGK